MAWIADQVERFELAGRPALEVGSLDVNGSVRSLFAGDYIGIDMRDGPGVDIVGLASDLPFRDAAFEVVVTTETFEHDPSFWRSLDEIRRVLVRGGHLLITTRGNGFGEHFEPNDYFRFMPNARGLLLDLAGCDLVEEALDPEVPGIFVHGVRR
jgi:SAM-dependent methyltransferase